MSMIVMACKGNFMPVKTCLGICKIIFIYTYFHDDGSSEQSFELWGYLVKVFSYMIILCFSADSSVSVSNAALN